MIDIQPFEKFSYEFVGVVPEKDKNGVEMPDKFKVRPLGTCFFIRKRDTGKLILVTANHNITAIDPFRMVARGPEFQYDVFGVVYYDSSAGYHKVQRITVDRTKLKTGYFFEVPDFVAIGCNFPESDKYFNSLEDYIVSPIKDFKLDSVFSIGFPTDLSSTYNIGKSPIHYRGSIRTVRIPGELFNDAIFHLLTPSVMSGMSGAPVFRIYSSKEADESKIIFGGVLFGSNVAHNAAYVVNPELVGNLLK